MHVHVYKHTLAYMHMHQFRSLAEENSQLKGELQEERPEQSYLEKKLLNVERELNRIKEAVAVGLGTEFEFGGHHASLAEIVDAGYEHTESGKRLLRLH